ncbi:MAG: hypothetical protein ACRD4Q_04315 [Candidatus Acidiferrales bacterium]
MVSEEENNKTSKKWNGNPEQLKIEGMPGPSKEEVRNAKLLENALYDLHAILEALTRGIPTGSKITVYRTFKGDKLAVNFTRGKE